MFLFVGSLVTTVWFQRTARAGLAHKELTSPHHPEKYGDMLYAIAQQYKGGAQERGWSPGGGAISYRASGRRASGSSMLPLERKRKLSPSSSLKSVLE